MAWVLLFVVVQYYDKKEQGGVQTTPTTITEPNISSITSIEDSNIIITVTEEEFNYPSEIDVVIESNSPKFTEEKALSIAKNYGFSVYYKKFVDINAGDTYIWSEDNRSLTVYLGTGVVIYKNNKSGAINKQLSDRDISSIAIEFVNVADIYGEKIDVFNIFTVNEADKIKRVNLTPTITDIPIVTTIPNASAVYTDIPQDGEVMNAYMRSMNNLLLTEDKYAIKNLEDIRSTIYESSVISMGDQAEFLPPISMGDINNVVINDIKLAYLTPGGTEKIYYPVFILTGNASLIPRTSLEPITLYLSALK